MVEEDWSLDGNNKLSGRAAEEERSSQRKNGRRGLKIVEGRIIEKGSDHEEAESGSVVNEGKVIEKGCRGRIGR